MTNACDEGDDLSGLGLNGSFPVFSSNLTLANCSLAEKIARLQQYQVSYSARSAGDDRLFLVKHAGLISFLQLINERILHFSS